MSPRTTEQFETIRQERRAEILDAALHVFADEGYHNSSVSQIAKKAGISKGLMYNYFESKESVLKALLLDLFDYAMHELKLDLADEMNDERMREVIRLSVDIPLKEPQRWKLYMSLAFQKDVTEMMMNEMMQKMQPYMQAMMGYFSGKGYDDPIAMMRIFSATLDGIQMHCLLDPKNFPAERAKEYLINQFVK
ncbi:MAG: helix-turn-helix domain-containing protein [Flavobacteriales bacterium]